MNNFSGSVLDFEFQDDFMSKKGYGAGWAYTLNNLTTPDLRFKVLGWSITGITYGKIDGTDYYQDTIQNRRNLQVILNSRKNIIFHNAPVDIGCLLILGYQLGYLKDQFKIYDTLVMANLYDNRLFKYDLDSLSKQYLKEEDRKSVDLLIDTAIKNEFVPIPKSANYNVKLFRSKVKKWCYSHMDVLQKRCPDVMAAYANQDTIATGNLFLNFLDKIPLKQAEYWSYFQLMEVDRRSKGCKIDLSVLENNIPTLRDEVNNIRKYLIKEFKQEFNLNSPPQLTKVLTKRGYKLPLSEGGNPSCPQEWLEENSSDPLLNKLTEYRTKNKILKDFLIKIQTMQIELGFMGRYGRLFPELKLFGAKRTGRFSSSNPNMQNQPKRHPILGKIIRSLFVPEKEDNYFLVYDWKSQEPRLTVHYGCEIKAKFADKMAKEFHSNPDLDIHGKTAEWAGILRNEAKQINLGINYGMQKWAMAKKLKKSISTTESILNKYHSNLPYIQQLIDYYKDQLISTGYIETLGNRKLYREGDGRDYTGISKKIQGSAADCMYKAYRNAYDQGVDVRLIIHDEFVIEVDSLDKYKNMQYIMKSTFQLNVPMPVEIKYGKNWGLLEELKIDEPTN